MKAFNFLLAGIAVVGLQSCSDDDSTSVNTNTSEVITTVQSGTWKITNFEEDGNDETNHFTGFNFTFGEDGVLTATKNDVTYTGSWSVTQDSSSDDDSPGSDIDFNIGFASPDDFTELNDDWDIMERTNTRIKLVDVSGGNGGTDYLTFEKN